MVRKLVLIKSYLDKACGRMQLRVRRLEPLPVNEKIQQMTGYFFLFSPEDRLWYFMQIIF